jgi:exoribonuclease R
MFTLEIANRDYTEWTFVPALMQEPAVTPLTAKLFHGDQVDSAGKLITDSPYRTNEALCGVLLTSQKTYGRTNKLLYKCVPDADHLPCFLVAYEEKQLGFNKRPKDKYITFRIKEWTEKHPLGLVTNTFGDVEDKEAYANYQLACKALNASLKLVNAATLRALRLTRMHPIPLYCENRAIEDRRGYRHIISIDPAGCQDIDDAIGLRPQPGGQSVVLSIYIANVPMLLEYLQLWSYLTDRPATIYLPTRKIPMLPVALSDNLCSLREQEDRVAFVLDFTLNKATARVETISYTSTLIRVEKNYVYGAPELLGSEAYKEILAIVKTLNDACPYLERISSSHDVVDYCMLRMNSECATLLQAKQSGIYRAATIKKDGVANQLDPELKRVLQSVAGEYCSYANRKPHELIGPARMYVHITSPIRRIVDTVNMLELLADRFQWSADAQAFKAKWQMENQLSLINTKSKAIRKLQMEMELLDTFEKNPERTYMGFIFDYQMHNKMHKYKVYLAETKWLTSVCSPTELKINTIVHLSAHLFLDEAKMTKKIRLQIV